MDEPLQHRPDPISLLERQAQARFADLVPIRHGRIAASPFAFYRAAAMMIATDLAATLRSGFLVRCCVDAHLSNFGVSASQKRRMVFDINDFDVRLPRPVRVGRETRHDEHPNRRARQRVHHADQQRAVLASVAAYRE